MIIFDLDGTLADCEHRRHFVDASKRDDCYYHEPATLTQSEGWYYKNVFLTCGPPKAKKFVPDWQAFYEACDKDSMIIPVSEVYQRLWCQIDYYYDFEIWSGRCESVRKKTENWLEKHDFTYSKLKMRPIGDNTPDDHLKEKWLNENISQGIEIEYVFDDCPTDIRMWQRRGIFFFNCAQHDEEF